MSCQGHETLLLAVMVISYHGNRSNGSIVQKSSAILNVLVCCVLFYFLGVLVIGYKSVTFNVIISVVIHCSILSCIYVNLNLSQVLFSLYRFVSLCIEVFNVEAEMLLTCKLNVNWGKWESEKLTATVVTKDSCKI